MDNFEEMQTALRYDLSISADSTLFTPDVVKLAINRAKRKVEALFKWPETESSKTFSTKANREYYDYPDNFRPDSVWKIVIDGNDYGAPLTFKDYLYEKENNKPSGRTYMWSSQWRRLFINPTPTTDGSDNVTIYGQKTLAPLIYDDDVTIFSFAMPEINEAIVLEAGAILRSKGEEDRKGDMLSTQAKQIIITSWNRIKQENAKYQPTQPFFDVPDYFAGKKRGSNRRIGDF